MSNVYVRITLYGELARRLKEYVFSEWSDSRGAQSLVMKRALKEYLDKVERERTILKEPA